MVTASGAQLNGQNTYAITFAKGQTPPVKGFWSLTLYNDLHLFNSKPLKRYSLAPRTRPQYNSDGSLTLYAGAKSPGKDKENNWLPAPTARSRSTCGPIGPKRRSSTDMASAARSRT